MSTLNTFFLVVAATLMVFTASAQYNPPPRNLQFDSLTLVATWEPPRMVLLDEHFEGAVFPPANWQNTTLGMGWFATANGSSATLNIPPHTTYAVVNNSLAGTGNNGCCDYLITPEMDLTQAEGYTLSFNSFFRGWDAETATVEISTDGGITWMSLLEVLPHFAWAELTVDLTAYSGPAGSQHVLLAFKASDNGNANATGWAVDDVVVMSEEMVVQEYYIFLDAALILTGNFLTITLPSSLYPYGTAVNLCVIAKYDSGLGQGICCNSTSTFLAPPQNLEAVINGSAVAIATILTWQPPSANLLSYNIYRNDSFLLNVPGTATVYWDILEAPGTYCYDISAVYDLTDLGFPGQIGESQLEGPACVVNSVSLMTPFLEDWTAGLFDNNLWNAGNNWLLDITNGDPKPTAMFLSLPSMTSYSSVLTSFYLTEWGLMTTTPNCLYLDFDYFLDDNTASGTEKLSIQVSDGNTWTTVKEIANQGDLGWTHERIKISDLVRNKIFRIRFNANGANSESIYYWMVDNIHVYTEYNFVPPANFNASNTGNTQQNDIQLIWGIPMTFQIFDVSQDDSTYENSLGINPGYCAWLGNKLNTGKGELRAAEVWWQGNGSASQSPVFVDVFDASHNLLGSSEAFVPAPGTWQSIALPDIAIDGDFYVMVRFERQAGTTAMLGMDSTTNSVRPNAGWYYDGSDWSQMNVFGFDECVFSLRAVVKKDVDCENNVIEKSTVRNFASSRNSMKSGNKSFSEFGLQSFDVYRREYQIPLPGQDSLLTDWQKIATLSTNTYLDQNLDFKCYQYYVEAMYSEGSSGPSNTDETCFLVGMDDLDAAGIKIYPNPAHDFIAIQTAGQVEQISIYNSIGTKVFAISQGTTSSRTLTMERLDVSRFSPGIYTIRISIKGESFNLKFVKM